MIKAECTNPGEIKFAITIEMRLSAWQQVADSMEDDNRRPGYPASELYDGIKDVIRQAKEKYQPIPKTEPQRMEQEA